VCSSDLLSFMTQISASAAKPISSIHAGQLSL